MKGLFVGARVRVVAHADVFDLIFTRQDPYGEQGRIVERDVISPQSQVPFDWKVQLDNGLTYAAMSVALEPIIPEGQQPATWQETVWHPEQVAV